MRVKISQSFSLIEVLIVLGIIATIMLIIAPTFMIIQGNNNLQINQDITIEALAKAQHFAWAGLEDSPWGVKLENNQITLFAGNSYANRQSDFDQVYDVSGVYFTIIDEVVFQKITGLPNINGQIVIHSRLNNRQKPIFINPNGRISQ